MIMSPGYSRAGIPGVYLENCIVVLVFFTSPGTQMIMSPEYKIKLLRAHGGCLGAGSR